LLVVGFPAEAFGTNCYIIAPAAGEQCVVVDPGIGVTDRLDDLLAEHRLQPVAVMLTHGHLDHTFSVTPVCGARGITAYIHPSDRELLTDPAKGLSTDLKSLFGGKISYSEPDDIAEMADGQVLTMAGLSILVDHAPGHTGGSVMFRTADAQTTFHGRDVRWPARASEAPLCFSGDVLFEGSIGRTDLPGGDMDAMWASLRDKVLPLADETIVLPGHGPATTIGKERAGNPYLYEAAKGAQPSGPNRGW